VTAIKKLVVFVRKTLDKYAKDTTKLAGAVDLVTEFFSDDSPSLQGQTNNEGNPSGGIVLTPKPIPRRGRLAANPEGTPVPPWFPSGESRHRKRIVPKPRVDPGEPNDETTSTVNAIKTYARLPRIIERKNGRHVLAFTATGTERVRISVFATGADSKTEKLPITQTSQGEIANGSVALATEVNERVLLDVKLQRPAIGAYQLLCEKEQS